MNLYLPLEDLDFHKGNLNSLSIKKFLIWITCLGLGGDTGRENVEETFHRLCLGTPTFDNAVKTQGWL